MEQGSITEAIALIDAGIDMLLKADRGRVTDTEVIDEVVGFEAVRRRIEAVEHVQIAELEQRLIPGERGYTTTTAFLIDRLRLAPAEANRRVKQARDLGPRDDLQGVPLAPIFPAIADAQATGAISGEHARIIVGVLDKIPSWLQAQLLPEAERFLTGQALRVDPRTLATIGQRLLDTVDPDGAQPRDDEQQRHGTLNLTRRSDGMVTLRGDVTPEFAAVWNPILDALAQPQPCDDGVGDDRTATQRRHDGVLEAGQRLLRSGTLPDCGGTPVTVVVKLNESDLRDRTGTATTDHDDPIDIATVLRMAAEADIINVVLNNTGGIINYGRTRRTASPGQRRALFLRDGGCTFPGCNRPASWCQAHHIVRWVDGGLTILENLCLLCGFHHREFEKRGWEVRVRDGAVEWIPPEWWDPDRKPIRNSAHHPPDIQFIT